MSMKAPCYSLTGSLIPRVREKNTQEKVEKGLVGGSRNYSELLWKGKPMSLMKLHPGTAKTIRRMCLILSCAACW